MRFVVKGSSMQPTFQDGDRIFASELFYKFLPPRVKDVAVVRDPRTKRLLLKRISKISGNKYTVTGDNPLVSTDSRMFGSLTGSAIVGKVLFRYLRAKRQG